MRAGLVAGGVKHPARSSLPPCRPAAGKNTVALSLYGAQLLLNLIWWVRESAGACGPAAPTLPSGGLVRLRFCCIGQRRMAAGKGLAWMFLFWITAKGTAPTRHDDGFR